MDRSVILVEGESDKSALQTAADVLGFDLASTSILVMNGVSNVARFLAEAVPKGVRVAGLYDAAERALVVRALSEAGRLADGRDLTALEDSGFFECDVDLEAELIRVLGADRVIEVIGAQDGDLRRFRTLQQMPEWRDRPVEDQLRRWFGSGSRRKVRYAALLVAALTPAEVPRPLRQVLEHALAR